MRKIAIIGGGAAGLTAAIAAGEAALHRQETVEITVFESSDRVGRTILATGNGRCNFSNINARAEVYNDPAFARSALANFEDRFNKPVRGEHLPNGVMTFFARHGLVWRMEGEGRLYPLANKSSVVLDVLRSAAARLGVREKTNSKVATIEPPREAGKHFTLRMADGVFERADSVIVACGGKVARDILPDDFAYAPIKPVLCPLATDTEYVRELENIRVKGAVELRRANKKIWRESGEVMFRKYGVSGICAFNLSRYAEPGDTLLIDFMTDVRSADMLPFLHRRRNLLRDTYGHDVTCKDFLRGLVLPQVADVFMKRAQLSENEVFAKDMEPKIAKLLNEFSLEVAGPADIDHAQVQRGGFEVSQFDSATMESKEIPGLFVVGEALDIDGPCGGYNLHWAFATGLLAGSVA